MPRGSFCQSLPSACIGAAALFLGVSGSARASLQYFGVNLAGAEFGENNLPGTFGTDYSYPGTSDVLDFVSRGFNTLRVPFRWERLQTTTGGALGNGQTDVELDYFIGQPFPFGSRWGFVDLGVGYRLRTAEPTDELRWYFTGGIELTDWLDFYFLEASGIHGLGNGEPQFVGDNILLTTDFDLIKVGAPALVEPVSGWIVQADPYFHVAGRATGAGGGFKVSVWREF